MFTTWAGVLYRPIQSQAEGEWVYSADCWFARDVTVAMLVVKNKSVSLRWELNSIFMQILQKKIVLYWPPTWPPCHVVANQELTMTKLHILELHYMAPYI